MPQNIKATELLAEAIIIVWREKNLAFLLAIFLSVISLIFLWPFMDFYAAFLGNFSLTEPMDEAAMNTLLAESMSPEVIAYELILLVPVLIIQFGVFALWSRASILGKSRAMEGGFNVLLKRTLWALWRYICGVGWMLVLMFAFWGIIMVITLLFMGGAQVGGGSEAMITLFMLLAIPLYIAFLFILMGLMLLMGVAVHGEVRDFHLPIYRAFRYLKGHLLKATGVLILALMAFYIFYMMVMGIGLGFASEVTATYIAFMFFFVNIFGMFFNFAWVSYGALYATKLVPELKE